jgi:hypothetical protein
MSSSKTTIRDIIDAVEQEKPVSATTFTEARAALATELLPPRDREYIHNRLDAAEGCVVERANPCTAASSPARGGGNSARCWPSSITPSGFEGVDRPQRGGITPTLTFMNR